MFLESNTLDLKQSTYLSVNENQIGSYLDYNYKKFSSKLLEVIHSCRHIKYFQIKTEQIFLCLC